MASDPTHLPHAGGRKRIVIDYNCDVPGPCLVMFAGLHGDEHGGVRAVERVRDTLLSNRPAVRGRVVMVLGNLAAIAAGKRYIEQDLNRNWYEDELLALAGRDPADDSVEDAERRELSDFIDTLDDEPNHPVVYVDLHSTSAEGLPFSCMPDTLTNLKIGLELPIPAILGLEDSIRGPLTGLLSDRGYAGVIVEGGQHDVPRTADLLEATVWRLMWRLRIISRDDVPGNEDHDRCLMHAGRDLPRVLEVSYQHETRAGDGFAMEPGFEHYDKVRKGQLLARDTGGDIRANMNARILMPAYKPGTDQGFFIIREVPWLKVQLLFLIRRLKLGNLVRWLPGMRQYGVTPNYLSISGWVPRRLVNVIRLLGWRRTYQDREHMILRRRRIRERSRVRLGR